MSGAASRTVVPLLVFEAADCSMAVLASEVSHLENRDTRPRFPEPHVDLGEYFGAPTSGGPWLRWGRGSRSAWLRVRRVIDVVPVPLASLTPMPGLLRADERTRAFLAAGVREDDVFLLLDPARLAS
jgi:hypothetical protein